MHEIHSGKKLDLNLLTIFDALFREGSVTRAADSLDLSQSAVSHALRRLRDFFNDPLFVKVGDSMRPTPKAEQMASSVLAIISTVQDTLITQARFDPATAVRTFRFCMTDMGELVFLPRMIQEFKRLAPHCSIQTLQVKPEDIDTTLESGEADLALGSQLSMSDSLFQQKLFTHKFVTIVSRDNKLLGDSITLEQFTQMKHVVINLGGKTTHYDRALDEHGIKRNVFLLTPHYLVIPMLIANDPQLIATVPGELGRFFDDYGWIRQLKPPVDLAPFPICQYWHPRFHHDEANRWLRQLMKEIYDGFLPDVGSI
ncbi:LysR family transcriptional regulator [Pseudomonas aeruginosa]|uniref:LysR family transcriptional regulator n=1 Tax=Pseudomonas aeruginosa TaxID=287 RepID=UPI0007A9E2BF|nr:LysR family transcriptional regulator [Pseudomonas aeruginosa]SAJ30142.1 LysR family transcriptional regulator [Enterobacter cloacae]ELK4788215.1 LysR family transcriptional regulator [Pseudomonas aeruginosa]ELK4790709.1 LysR family transcriptional regulator [Pseudomonas aeruginosa]MBG6790988.1 LysR family transcriptional regulator [Pseudomonas aeruginosa]MBG6799181.1 LysR family transcriptional regulator [Pseudomonas aeruginosa]